MASVSGSLTLRLTKGSPLTYAELDGNFLTASYQLDNLNNNVVYTNLNITASQSITGSLRQGATGNITIGTGSHAEGLSTITSSRHLKA